jgi:GNAT superfamily N-acetyltransferase
MRAADPEEPCLQGRIDKPATFMDYPRVDERSATDGQIIGFACVGTNRDDDTDTATCELWGLYLDPAHWGAGHGHTLHTEALDVARASGAAAAILWVLTTNQRVRHFYERHGWAADGAEKTVWRGDVRLDETRYRISLRAWAPTP